MPLRYLPNFLLAKVCRQYSCHLEVEVRWVNMPPSACSPTYATHRPAPPPPVCHLLEPAVCHLLEPAVCSPTLLSATLHLWPPAALLLPAFPPVCLEVLPSELEMAFRKGVVESSNMPNGEIKDLMLKVHSSRGSTYYYSEDRVASLTQTYKMRLVAREGNQCRIEENLMMVMDFMKERCGDILSSDLYRPRDSNLDGASGAAPTA